MLTRSPIATHASVQPHFRRLLLSAMLIVIAGCLTLTPAATATTAAPAWTITSTRAPTNFAPGDHSGQDSYLVTVTNSGGAATDSSVITITDTLPGPALTLHPTGLAASSGFTCSA